MNILPNHSSKLLLLSAVILPFSSLTILAQGDSISVIRKTGTPSFFVGAGAVFDFRPVILNYNSTFVFENGWGVNADYMQESDRYGTLGTDQSAFVNKRKLANVRVLKEIPLANQNFRLQLAAGPSLGHSKSTYWSAWPNSEPQWSESKKLSLGMSSKVSMIYRINKYIGLSGGVHLGFNNAVSVNGPELSLLIGKFGTYTDEEVFKLRSSRVFSSGELRDLEIRYRRQAGWALAVGGVVTAMAVAANTLGVVEYHKDDNWSRLGGTVSFAMAHLALAPGGTSLLILGFGKRGKANQIRDRIWSEN